MTKKTGQTRPSGTVACCAKGAVVKLPHAEQAIAVEEKFTTYLLDETHQEGRGKALFFQHFGFSVAQ